MGIEGAILGSAALNAGAGLYGASKSADATKDATSRQVDEMRRQYDINRADQMPYMEAGYNALADLEGYAPFKYDMYADPGYQFALKEGQKAGTRAAAARGHGNSGNVLAELSDRATGLASTYSNDIFNRQLGEYGTNLNRTQSLAGMGQSSIGQVGNAGMNAALGISNAYGQQGRGLSDAYYSGANALSNAGNAGIRNWLQYDYLNPSTTYSTRPTSSASALNTWRDR